MKRGALYFSLNEFHDAIDDYDTAIEIDSSLDYAWFGRGMAHGRLGFIDEGIADLSVYIKRNPKDTRALTKRGVRYLWKGDKQNARRDLELAIKIDPGNAEAHDDLGIVLSQLGDYRQVIKHFSKTIEIEPDYQKAHHNLAMALYITENDIQALRSVNNAIALKSDARDSVLLKSKILIALDRLDEARELEDEAMFLPQGNWSESVPVQ